MLSTLFFTLVSPSDLSDKVVEKERQNVNENMCGLGSREILPESEDETSLSNALMGAAKALGNFNSSSASSSASSDKNSAENSQVNHYKKAYAKSERKQEIMIMRPQDHQNATFFFQIFCVFRLSWRGSA